MRVYLAPFVCIAIGTLVAGLAPGPASAQQLTELGGPGLYERFCASCHGLEGRGDGPVAASLALPASDLTRLAQRYDGEYPANYVRRTIDGGIVEAHGPRYMPVWGYEFWVEEGADFAAMQSALDAIELLVDYIHDMQETE